MALVMARNSHDGAGSVANEYVIRDPDRDSFLIDRIYGVSAGENPGFLLGEVGAFEIGFRGNPVPVLCQCSSLFGRGHPVDQRMLWRKYHISRAEKRVGARGKDRDHFVQAVDTEYRLGTLAAANPISL